MNSPVNVQAFRARRMIEGSWAPVALAPDGILAVYGVVPVQRELPKPPTGMLAMGASPNVLGYELWIVDLRDGSVRELSAGLGSCWGPRWSPDGQWLAFYSDRNGVAQVWLWNRKTGETRAACEDAVCMMFEFEQLHWLPDSTRLVAKLRAPGWNPPAECEEEAAGSDRDVWESPVAELEGRSSAVEGWRSFDNNRGDIGVINIDTGETRRLGTDIYPYGFAPSPDGCFVAAMSVGDSDTFDLHLFAFDGSRREVLARHLPLAWGTFTWSPAGDRIVFTTYSEDAPGQLVLVSLDGEQRVLHDGSEVDFTDEEPYPPPLWSPDGDTVYCRANLAVYAVSVATGAIENITRELENRVVWGCISTLGDNVVNDGGQPGTVLVVTRNRETQRQGIYRVGNDQPEEVLPEQQHHLIYLMLYGDSNHSCIVGPIESASHPFDLYRIAIGTGEIKRVTHVDPEFSGVDWGSTQLLAYPGVEGETLQGVALLPPGYRVGVRYPALVVVYPAMGTVGYLNQFDLDRLGFIELHALASQGYVVIAPSMPRRHPSVADEMTTLALNALDAAAAAGYVDPERAGVIGHSAGGYSVCCVVTRTGRFRAAVAGAPIANLISYGLSLKSNGATNVDGVTGHVFQLREGLWDARERWVENSPVFYCDQVTTPLLLICGTADEPMISQAEEMYGGLSELGKRAALVRYHGEGHHVGEWSTENAQDCWDRIIGWFDRYVKGDETD